MEHCVNCLTELNHLDDDPNGDKNPVCAKCRAEEAHDFDAEPDVEYDRAGHRIEKQPTKKIYQKIINNNCHECPACYQPWGQGYYLCERLRMDLGYNDDNIPIPRNCPLKDAEDNIK